MWRRVLISFFVLLAASVCARGQFYTTGQNPASLRWYQVQTPSFRIIYPEGLDSLAREYGSALERYRVPVGRTLGFAPNEAYRRRMPVILEAWTSVANGTVVWTPRRMQLHTCMDALSPDSMPWMDNLAVHEGRHVAQMQFTHAGHFKPFGWLTGELVSGGLAGAYGGSFLFEGDAVVAETALSQTGRGRRADWLEAYKVAFADGDWRDWCRWRYGSIIRYTPDHYTSGYMWYAGVRSFYDEPLYLPQYFNRLLSHKLWWFPFKDKYKTTKAITGLGHAGTWRALCEDFEGVWKANEDARGPFLPDSLITTGARHYTSYSGSASAGENIFSIKSGYAEGNSLVKTDRRGNVERLTQFGAQTSGLRYSPALGRLYWSEIVTDKRWGMKSTSRIRYYDPASGRKVSITREGRFFNPSPSDSLLTVTEYPVKGGSAICMMDGQSGEVLGRWQAPDSLQVVESATLDGHVYATGISPAGFGIYAVDEDFRVVLAPQPVNINCLQEHEGSLWYTSDLNGSREVYQLDGERITRVTNSRFGVSSFTFAEGSGDIFYSSLDKTGRMLRHAPMLSLEPGERYEDPVAAKLSAQEKALAPKDEEPCVTEFSEVTRYRKALHALHIHSWAPVWFNYDNVSSFSLDNWYHTAAPGATVFFQNDLQTLFGQAGASYWDKRAAGHLSLTYSGLYPVFKVSLDYNERSAYNYNYLSISAGRNKGWSITRGERQDGVLSGTIQTYVPLTFSSGGWYRGVVPQLKWTFSNDAFNTSTVGIKYLQQLGTDNYRKVLSKVDTAPAFFMGRMIASLRGYVIQPTPVACVYPRFGIGAEVGYGMRPALTEFFSPAAYAYLYGYLPGFAPGHGIRLSAIGERLSEGSLRGESYISAVPRGYASVSSSVSSFMATRTPVQARVTSDYKATLLPVEWSLFDYFLYIRNFELGAHFDGTIFTGGTSTSPKATNSGSLFSAGASIAAHLQSVCWIGVDTTVGVECSFNGGPSYGVLKDSGIPLQRVYCGMIFTTDF